MRIFFLGDFGGGRSVLKVRPVNFIYGSILTCDTVGGDWSVLKPRPAPFFYSSGLTWGGQ